VETEDSDVAIVGGGVVGCAVALALVRRGVATALLEAESEPGLAASGTNSGILHTGFDSVPGELETELILRSASLRDPMLAGARATGASLWRPLAPGEEQEAGAGPPRLRSSC
jgi:glycerol-3-phosphate dehydrogenase